jgi:hypothetical protein
MNPYTLRKEENALGTACYACGPGMTHYTTVMLMQRMNPWARQCYTDAQFYNDNSKQLLILLERAYNAGKQAKAEEVRQILGCQSSER